MNKIGLYIHVPFCRSKCPYCDFYSLRCNDGPMDAYTDAVLRHIEQYSQKLGAKADTLYLGGGTPSALGADRLTRMIDRARSCFSVNGETTVECNPSSDLGELLRRLADSGVNRISMGLQSSSDSERRALGRQATAADTQRAVEDAMRAGIDNISLDLMLGIPGQTRESLARSVRFCAESGASHVSAYILKVEENTHFWRVRDSLKLPDEDEVCDLYLEACALLESSGFRQYEISNFAKPGRESRHNLKYWSCDEYLGLGPSSHSFIDGRRFYFERDLDKYLSSPAEIDDGAGGGLDEYVMLRLRLTDGLRNDEVRERFGFDIPRRLYENARGFERAGLLTADSDGIRLTRDGFLLSNRVISGILE